MQVNSGSFGGSGTIAGPVTMGTATGGGAVLIPVSDAVTASTLTIQRVLTFDAFSEYELVLDGQGALSEVSAAGVTLDNNVTFHIVDDSTGKLAKGRVFKVINNTSANAISGRFDNLLDGAVYNTGSMPSKPTIKVAMATT